MLRQKLSAVLLSGLLLPNLLSAHCQVPCGIYDDHMRIHMLEEHVTTMEKGMKQVTTLSAEGEKNYNQIVRWVSNKDSHADQFIDIVCDYYLAQRIIPTDATAEEYGDYQQKLELLHRMIVSAMKCKQTTDHAHIETLRKLIKEFEALYNKNK